MQDRYLSLAGECVTEKIIEKSRFITTSRHIVSEREAKAFIAEIAQKYRDATHNCYAYIADDKGNFLRFSDDGEPQGTAGMPMLEVLKTNGLREAAVVVTRYFGGIKLGAGGLVRAYSGSVAENIVASKKVTYQLCSEFIIKTGYASVDALLRFLGESNVGVLNTEYLNEAIFSVAVKSEEEESFKNGLVNYINGKVEIGKSKQYFYPFEI